MQLQFLLATYSVCQLNPTDPVPDWASDFLSICRTDEELTVITSSDLIPDDVTVQRNFACFRVSGNLAFDVIGVIARISTVLADSKIPILSVSTYNTDYFLIPHRMSDVAIAALEQAGFEFVRPSLLRKAF